MGFEPTALCSLDECSATIILYMYTNSIIHLYMYNVCVVYAHHGIVTYYVSRVSSLTLGIYGKGVVEWRSFASFQGRVTTVQTLTKHP